MLNQDPNSSYNKKVLGDGQQLEKDIAIDLYPRKSNPYLYRPLKIHKDKALLRLMVNSVLIITLQHDIKRSEDFVSKVWETKLGTDETMVSHFTRKPTVSPDQVKYVPCSTFALILSIPYSE